MSKDDVIRMATEAGLLEPGYIHGNTVIAELERFAALAAAAEREACAQVCEETDNDPHVVLHVGTVCAAAIRARGQA